MKLKLKSLWKVFSKKRRHGRPEQFFISKKEYQRKRDKKSYERNTDSI